jgi:hypothetical protein
MTSFHGDLAIVSVEAGVDPWYARIGCAKLKLLGINGAAFPHPAIAVAWPDRTVTVEDAKSQVDRLEPRASRDTSGIQPATIA